jgi:hypothetical protein
MKKFFAVLLTVIVLCGLTNAQTAYGTKGVWEVGGGLGYTRSTEVVESVSGVSTNEISLMPFVGYFVIDNVQVGLLPDYESVSSGGVALKTFNIFLVPAYYFVMPTKVKQHPYIRLLGGFSTSSFAGVNTGKGVSGGLGAGVKSNLGDNSLLNVGIDYIIYTLKPSYVNTRFGHNDIDINIGFAMVLF